MRKNAALGGNGLETFTERQNFDVTKLKSFADGKFHVATVTISFFDIVEYTVGIRKNAGYQHFLLFSQNFQKASDTGSLKVGIL